MAGVNEPAGVERALGGRLALEPGRALTAFQTMDSGRINRMFRGWSNDLYWKLRPVIVPGLENSQYAYARVLKSAVAETRRWLDVGCGHQIFPAWFSDRQRELGTREGQRAAVGVDLDFDALRKHLDFKLRAQADIQAMPFRNESFDLVAANMVLEHIEVPAEFFREVSRVLAPGGRFLAHTPNAVGYTTILTKLIPRGVRARAAALIQAREPRDVYPTHYLANSRSVLGRLADEAGLVLTRFEYVQSSPQMTLIPIFTVLEMVLIRLLSLNRLSHWRPCLIVELQKCASATSGPRA
jgi:SAM-dependent methyltransferase